MKRILYLIVFSILTTSAFSQVFLPSKMVTINNPIGVVQGQPLDGRSYYCDTSAHPKVYRPFRSTAEVLTYLPLTINRIGQYPIVVHVGGTLNGDGSYTGGTNMEYWFKDGTADSNLVIKELVNPTNSANWNTAYNKRITGINFDSTTRILTLTLFDGTFLKDTLILAGGGGGGANNYTTSISYNTGTGILTLNRNGLSSLVASIPPSLTADSIKRLPVDTTENRNNYVLAFDSVNHKFYLTPQTGGSGTPPGNDQDVIFNDGGVYGASDNFAFDKINRGACIGCGVSIGDASISGGGAMHGALSIFPENGSLNLSGDTVTLKSTAGTNHGIRILTNNQERFKIITTGDVLFPTLTSTSDSGANKPAVFNPTTKVFTYLDHWPVGSSVSASGNADSIKKLPVDTTLNADGNVLTFDKVAKKMVLKPIPVDSSKIQHGPGQNMVYGKGDTLVDKGLATSSALLNVSTRSDSVVIVKPTNDTTAFPNGAMGYNVAGRPGVYTIPVLIGYTPENVANKNSNSGYAGLNSSGKVAPAQLDTTHSGTGLVTWQGLPAGGSSTTVRDSLSYVNAAKFNVVADGVTDNTAALQGLVNTSKGAIYIPKGIHPYIFTGTIQMKDSVTIFGDGLQTVLKQTSNVPLFRLGYATGGLKCTLEDFTIQGTYGGTGNTSQKGIVCDSVNGVTIRHIGGFFMGGPVITIMNNALMPGGNNYTYGDIVDGCYGQTNQAGIWVDVRGEYNRITNNMFNDGGYGLYVAGGNNIITGNNFSADTYGIYLDGGANHGHGPVTGNSSNHNVYGIYINNVTLGMSLSNNMFYTDSIVIVNSDAIKIQGGDIDPTGIRITNSTNINFVFPDFKSIPTWVVSGSTGSILRSTIGGISITNINATMKGTEISNSDGVINYGSDITGTPSPNVQQHIFHQEIVGLSGVYDGQRDAALGSIRVDVPAGSSISDPNQLYFPCSSCGTKSVFAALDNLANYGVRVLAVGNTGFGGTPDASAKVDIQSTSQGFLIPRMTTTQRDAITSPVTSLLLYNTTVDSFQYRAAGGTWQDLGAGSGSGISDPGSNGILSRTATNTVAARTLTGTNGNVVITNGTGVSGNPTFDIGANVSQTVFIQTSDATVANTTSETTLVGSGVGNNTFSSGYFVSGRTIVMKGFGKISTDVSAGNLTFKFLNSTSAISATFSPGNSLNNSPVEYEFTGTTRSTGGGGTIMIAGWFSVGGVKNYITPTSAAFDTTTSETFGLSVTWATASASNTITNTNMTIEIKR